MSLYSALNKGIDLLFSIQTLSIIGFCIVLKKLLVVGDFQAISMKTDLLRII